MMSLLTSSRLSRIRTAWAFAFILAIFAIACSSGQVPSAQASKGFRIAPVRPIEELRREALAATPPAPEAGEIAADLVDVKSLAPTIHLDIRYATPDNFLGTPVYETSRALLQRPAAAALARVVEKLKVKGYGLIVFDAYRPWYVTKIFWEATPADKHEFVADPAQGSRHNRGCAVDVSLYRLKSGQEVVMPSGYDEMTDRAAAKYIGGSKSQRAARDLLRRTMEGEGFRVYSAEWWHFDYRDWKKYPILNLPFSAIP